MLRFEASLARAQASVGLIPEAAAESVIGSCKVELFDVAKIVRESGRAGSIAIPLVKTLKETVGLFNKEAAGFVHFGSTSQDVIDTALALVTRAALNLPSTAVCPLPAMRLQWREIFCVKKACCLQKPEVAIRPEHWRNTDDINDTNDTHDKNNPSALDKRRAGAGGGVKPCAGLRHQHVGRSRRLAEATLHRAAL